MAFDKVAYREHRENERRRIERGMRPGFITEAKPEMDKDLKEKSFAEGKHLIQFMGKLINVNRKTFRRFERPWQSRKLSSL